MEQIGSESQRYNIMKKEFLLQFLFFIIGLTSFGNDAAGQGTTDISGTIFTGVKVTGVEIVGGSISNYVRGDGSVVAFPVVQTYTDLSGTPISITKRAIGTVTPNTGDGYSINISGAGFTNVLGVSITPVRASVTVATASPKVSIESISTSAIVVNIIEGNPNTVNILGSLVLLGTSETFVTSFTGLTLKVEVYGN
jgi:hypothetical protein